MNQAETKLQPARPRGAPQRGLAWARALAIVALAVLAYSPTWQAGFVWDDDANVTENLPLRDADGLRALWLEPGATTQYYPLVYTSFWLEHAAWGFDPLGYHVDNVLLHAANAVVFWRLLALFGLGAGAWWAALVFALHPVHVESVAWVTERKNVLSGLFYLGAAFVYLRSACDLFRSPARRERRVAWVCSLALFVAALLSKSPTASLPAALLLVVWWRRGRIAWGDVRPLLPFFALGVPIGLLTTSMEANVGDVLGFDWQPSLVERVLLAGRATWFYLSKLLVPWPLMFVYPRWELDDGVAWQYAFPLAAIALLAVLYSLRDRIGRAPLAAALFFGGTLLPVLGVFEIYFYRFSFVADHWQYLASLAPIALLVGGGLGSCGARTRSAVGALLVVTLAGLTVTQARVYFDSQTLWRDALAHNPTSPMVHYNLGRELHSSGRLGEAAAHYRRAIMLAPDSPNAYNNLATIWTEQGRSREALELLEEAVRLAPDYTKARWNLALELERQGRFERARPHFARSIEDARAQGENEDLLAASRLYFARALLTNGRPALALRELDALLAERPDLLPAKFARGQALMRIGRAREAASMFQAVLDREPDHPAARAGLTRAQADEASAQGAVGRVPG